MDRNPWEIHPELTADRLLIVAELLRDIRHDALPYHEPEKGDTNWGLGTRVTERTWHAIRDAANDYGWLRIINPGKHFVFSIGGVPFRFYRGLPERPQARFLARQFPEILQHQLAFEFYQSENDYFWRLAIETDLFGEVLRIVVAQMSESGDVKTKWEVPLSRKISALGTVTEKKPEGVELLPPVVAGKKKGKLTLVPRNIL